MENDGHSLLSLPVQFVLLMGGVMLLVAVVSGYCPIPGTCNSNPSVFGHSSEEVQFTVTSVVNNCSSLSSPDCVAVCPTPPIGEAYYAVSGYCVVSPTASAFLTTAGLQGTNSWKCTYPDYPSVGVAYVAVVNCLLSGV